jgi:hypothetical protein
MEAQYNAFYNLLCLLDESDTYIILLAWALARRRHLDAVGIGEWYIKPRSTGFLNLVHDAMFDDVRFRQQFRMGRAAFMDLLGRLEEPLGRMDTNFRSAVHPYVQLLVFLHYMGSGAPMAHTGEQLALGTTTVSGIVHDVAEAIVEHLRHQYIYLPGPEEAMEISAAFQQKSNLPQCVGTIDGSHIAIPKPWVHGVDYYGHHGFYAIILQGVVDHKRQFRSVDVGFPGAVTDARVLRNSNFGKHYQEWLNMIPSRTVEIGTGAHANLAPYVLGDCGYSNEGQIITTYTMPQARASADVKHFNRQLSKMRYTVECAFGILKGRFRVLQKLHVASSSPVKASFIIAALCVVHNFLINCNDRMEDEEQLLREQAEIRAEYEWCYPARIAPIPPANGQNGVHVSEIRHTLFQHAVHMRQHN